MATPVPRVVFLCTANSCRSQIAEALTRDLFGARIEAASAGVRPGDGVNPLALRVLAEAGVDVDALYPKNVRSLIGRFDLLVTVCSSANDDCPDFAAATSRVHAPFDDPPAPSTADAEDLLPIYRALRDRIRDWLTAELPLLLPGVEADTSV